MAFIHNSEKKCAIIVTTNTFMLLLVLRAHDYIIYTSICIYIYIWKGLWLTSLFEASFWDAVPKVNGKPTDLHNKRAYHRHQHHHIRVYIYVYIYHIQFVHIHTGTINSAIDPWSMVYQVQCFKFWSGSSVCFIIIVIFGIQTNLCISVLSA